MHLNKPHLKACREARRSVDRKARQVARWHGRYAIVKRGLWWSIMQEGSRGLLVPIAHDFATRSAALRVVLQKLSGDRYLGEDVGDG